MSEWQSRSAKLRPRSTHPVICTGWDTHVEASGCAERELHLVVFQVKTSSDEVHLIAQNGKFVLGSGEPQ